jgi:CheY-like chemotaxis protein
MFAGKRVLLAEDEAILAMSAEDVLVRLGCTVVGPAFSAANALELARVELLDAALLDINMGDGASFPVAKVLREKQVPFCFATGYGAAGVPAELSHVPVLQKPYSEEALAQMLSGLMR